jgi:translation initiation factor 2B subunit (eIF-2B alpha/beta/delta family)
VVGIAEGLEELARAGPGRRTPGQMRGWIAARRRRLAREEREVLRRARRAFPPGAAVVTLSASSLVARLLGGFRAERRPSRVIVLASRPGGEGVSLARTLQRRQVPTRLIPDREGPRAVRGTTVLLVGADTIYADGSLLHKVGTRRMAEAAFRANVPVVSLSGSSKFLRRRPPRRLPGGGWFDLTPPRWVSAYWTERGALRPDQVGARLGGLSPDRRRTR